MQIVKNKKVENLRLMTKQLSRFSLLLVALQTLSPYTCSFSSLN